VHAVAADAYAHQDLPFAKLIDELRPERDPSRTPLFQAMLDFQPPLPALDLPGLVVSPFEFDGTTEQYDVTLRIAAGADGLTAAFEYDRELFDPSTIGRMATHFQTLLKGVVAHPDQCISQLPILTEAERHQLLVEWNGGRGDYAPEHACIHELFEAQVKRVPSVVAVISEAGGLTYQELDRRANRVAQQLQAMGVRPETLVGICMERSLEMMVGLLGILKAGGAYLPLDPAYPSDRLGFMLEDANVPVLVTQRGLVDRLPKHDAQVLCLDDAVTSAVDTENDERPQSGVTPQNLAYVMYTSGSTVLRRGS